MDMLLTNSIAKQLLKSASDLRDDVQFRSSCRPSEYCRDPTVSGVRARFDGVDDAVDGELVATIVQENSVFLLCASGNRS